MLKKIWRYKWYVLAILLFIVIDPIITSQMYLLLQRIYNQVTVGTEPMRILQIMMMGVIIWIVKRLVLFGTSILRSRFVCNIKQDVRHDLFANMLGLKTANLAEHAGSGEYISMFTNDITLIEQRYFDNIIGLLSSIINIIVLGSTFFSMNYKLAGIVFVFGIVSMLVPPIYVNRLKQSNLNYSNKMSEFTQKIKEYTLAYPTIKNYSVERKILEHFDMRNDGVENAKFQADCALARADNIGNLLTWFTRLLVIGAGLVMLSRGEVLLGTVIAAQEFAGELSTPLQSIISNINAIKSVKSVVSKIEYMSAGEDTERVEAEEYLPEALDVKFDNVTVHAGGKDIVQDFSFTFEQGKKYLVIGKNGAGKSTVFKTLKKRFSDYSGDIMINDRDVRGIDNENLSKLISYLNENVSIFSGSVKENVLLMRECSDDTYGNAISRAKMELPSAAPVNEDGNNISSGEQRRIEIARSMILPARMMIFDEVVSTLDIETAYEIENMALDFDDKTVVFISHNFSGKLIRKYDEILVIRDSRLVAHGSYDELMNSCEYFRTICSIKFGDIAAA